MSSGPEPNSGRSPVQPWKTLRSEPGPDLIIARARFDIVENPRTGQELRRCVLATPDWVNIVALTPERKLVCVRQYRFGEGRVTTEIPGGVVDPGEEPAVAAQRELREETGFTADRWRLLRTVAPNPAFLQNHCHHFLAEDARQTHGLELDPGEDIQVSLLSRAETVAAIDAGEIRHSLVISALAHVWDLRPESP